MESAAAYFTRSNDPYHRYAEDHILPAKVPREVLSSVNPRQVNYRGDAGEKPDNTVELLAAVNIAISRRWRKLWWSRHYVFNSIS